MDIDALLTPARWTGKRCTVVQALEEIKDHEKYPNVVAACDDSRVPAANIVTVFTSLIGDSPKVGTIRRHQRRRDPEYAERCECP